MPRYTEATQRRPSGVDLRSAFAIIRQQEACDESECVDHEERIGHLQRPERGHLERGALGDGVQHRGCLSCRLSGVHPTDGHRRVRDEGPRHIFCLLERDGLITGE